MTKVIKLIDLKPVLRIVNGVYKSLTFKCPLKKHAHGHTIVFGPTAWKVSGGETVHDISVSPSYWSLHSECSIHVEVTNGELHFK